MAIAVLPFAFSCRMGAGHAYGLVAESGEGLDWAGGPAGSVEVVEGVGAEQVLQRTWFAEAAADYHLRGKARPPSRRSRCRHHPVRPGSRLAVAMAAPAFPAIAVVGSKRYTTATVRCPSWVV